MSDAPATWREKLIARILLTLAAMFAPDHKTAKAINDLYCHINVCVPKEKGDE